MTGLIKAQQLLAVDANWPGVLVDCRYCLDDSNAGYETYLQGHIPGAHYVGLGTDLSSPGPASAGRHPLPPAEEFAGLLGRLGVDSKCPVVAYDDTGGQMAARFWWLCRWLGVDQVILLDGGWQAWQRCGGPITREIAVAVNSHFAAEPITDLLVTTEQLKVGLDEEAILLIDARASARYRGEQEPLDPVAGHIPGAVNHPSGLNLAGDGCFQPADTLRASFASLLGQYSPHQVVHSCGSGVTACHNLLAMELAGLCGSRLYAPSWSGWIADPGGV